MPKLRFVVQQILNLTKIQQKFNKKHTQIYTFFQILL